MEQSDQVCSPAALTTKKELSVVTDREAECTLGVVESSGAEEYPASAGYRIPVNQNVQFIQPQSHCLVALNVCIATEAQ